MGATRTRRLLAGIVGAVVLAGMSTAPAGAAAPSAAPPPAATSADSRALDIRSTAEDLVTPATAHPGPTTFRASTTAEGSGWIGLARLRPGVTWESFLPKLRDTVSEDPARIVAGSAALAAAATLLGGVVIHPGRPGSFTEDLRPGTYLLFDYTDVTAAPQPRHRILTVAGPASGREPRPTATLRAVDVAAGPRFEISGTLRAGRPLGLENSMTGRQFAEAVFFSLAADVTEEELARYFDTFPAGEGSPELLDLTAGAGSLPLSTGQDSVVQLPLGPGRYVVVNFLKDADDGVPLVRKGQYRIAEVR